MKKQNEKKDYYKGDKDTFMEFKVISRNIITDWVQRIRNMLGLELKSYTNAIKETTEELFNKANTREIDWFKIDIEEFGRGGFMISVYGAYKK